MKFYRETIKKAPSFLSIPKEFRNRDVEIIILPLDEEKKTPKSVDIDFKLSKNYPLSNS